ncbi:peptidase M19 [Rudanella paleaurantiibacter]|uniref:Peptidase M19 n=1 Tax=Rudanella paleaurantiibacter TaxID=2614655 RepID=A0A7J5U461_9BACT|nr:membrane dipeptidase [Rudanella paleaurantiibacter]KAB7732546.1 peptidase M19 [Rudanella paleaurantiibacter]
MIIDAHLDISLNAMEWNRDYRYPVAAIRASEQGMDDKIDRGRGVVSLPELRRGGIGLVVATQIARFNGTDYTAASSTLTGAMRPGAGWSSPEQAWAMTQAQRAWYEAMEDDDSAGFPQMRQIRDRAGLEAHLALWQDTSVPNEQKPVGYILSLEGADSLVRLSYLERAYGYGLRALGPAHYGPGRYAPGTGMNGPLTALGRDLLREMDNLNMVLDVTHLTDEGFDEALTLYKGRVWASHHNCRALVPHQRQLTDEQIRRLIERDAVIGGCLDAWMMKPGLTQRQSNPADFGVTLDTLIDHYDHICQLAGNARHIAIGSDLDGTFGTEQSPVDLDTIADLARLPELLAKRGYSPDDIDGVMYGNWLRFLREAWT